MESGVSLPSRHVQCFPHEWVVCSEEGGKKGNWINLSRCCHHLIRIISNRASKTIQHIMRNHRLVVVLYVTFSILLKHTHQNLTLSTLYQPVYLELKSYRDRSRYNEFLLECTSLSKTINLIKQTRQNLTSPKPFQTRLCWPCTMPNSDDTRAWW